MPSDADLEDALRRVRLEALLQRSAPSGGNGAGPPTGLDWAADWAGMLSLGEQQRLAFARCGS